MGCRELQRNGGRRAAVAMILGLLASGAAMAKSTCEETQSQVKNRDGRSLHLVVALCRAAGERRFTVNLAPAAGHPFHTVLHTTQRLAEAPDGTAAFVDLDGDGANEVEIRGSCGTGPNCEGTIYRLAADSLTMVPYFRSGYASLTMIDDYLVESSRASCCAWESHGFKVDPAAKEITEKDLVLRIDVSTEGGEDGKPLAVECSFHRREGESWTDVDPPSNAWLPLCEQYGKKYKLRSPAPAGKPDKP